jgi:hypothetical protein
MYAQGRPTQHGKPRQAASAWDANRGSVAAAAIRTNSFWANDALFLTGLIAYNLLNCIRRLGLSKALETARLKRLGLLLLELPANVIRRSRQLWVKIKWDHPMRHICYRAMAALQ